MMVLLWCDCHWYVDRITSASITWSSRSDTTHENLALICFQTLEHVTIQWKR